MSKQSNRGKEAKDDIIFSPQAIPVFKEALHDLNFLLTREYTIKNALHTVATRYQLTQRQMKALQGMGASQQYINQAKCNELTVHEIIGKELIFDGFNTLILLESMFSGAYLFKGADRCYRDLSGVHGTYKRVNQTSIAIDAIVTFHKQQSIKKITWIFDKPVSNSGRIKKMLEEIAEKEKIHWTILLEDKADEVIIEHKEIIISSDAYIIENAKKWFNFIHYLITNGTIKANVFDVDLTVVKS